MSIIDVAYALTAPVEAVVFFMMLIRSLNDVESFQLGSIL